MHCRFFLRLMTAALGISCLFLYSCEKDEQIAPAAAERTATPAKVYSSMNDILLESLEDPVVRDFIRTEALKRVTYDYEVVYGMVKHQPMTDGRTLEQAFLSVEEDLVSSGRISGSVVRDLQTTTPLLSINVPVGIFDWNTKEYAPAVVLDPEARKKEDGSVEGYFADGRSQTFRAGEISEEFPVITLADNERMLYTDGKYELDRSLYLFVAPSKKGGDNSVIMKNEPIDWEDPGTGGGGGGGGGTGGGGTGGGSTYDNCNRQFDDYVNITGISMDNVSSYEFLGRPELRLNILGGDGEFLAQQGYGNRVVDANYNPPRSAVSQTDWYSYDDFLYGWRSKYGQIISFRWDEEDGGSFIEFTDLIEVEFQGQNYFVDAPVFTQENREFVGMWRVYLDGCLLSFYGSSPALRFRLRFSD